MTLGEALSASASWGNGRTQRPSEMGRAFITPLSSPSFLIEFFESFLLDFFLFLSFLSSSSSLEESSELDSEDEEEDSESSLSPEPDSDPDPDESEPELESSLDR